MEYFQMNKLDHDGIRSTVDASVVGEADHRVANHLMMIVGTLKAQASDLAGPMLAHEVRSLLDEAAGRIEIVARLHRLLSQQTGDAVDVSIYLRDVCEALALSLNIDDRFTLTGLDTRSCLAPAKQAFSLVLMASELVTNAIRFSHPSGVAGRIDVACNRQPSSLTLTVTDDGVGLPEGFDPMQASSTGLRLLHTLALGLHADLTFDSSPLGLRVEVNVP